MINRRGQVLFSPLREGIWKATFSKNAPDLRRGVNRELGNFIDRALKEKTGLTLVEIDGQFYYLTGVPMETLGWSVISVVEKDVTDQPARAMLREYDQINDSARGATAPCSTEMCARAHVRQRAYGLDVVETLPSVFLS